MSGLADLFAHVSTSLYSSVTITTAFTATNNKSTSSNSRFNSINGCIPGRSRDDCHVIVGNDTDVAVVAGSTAVASAAALSEALEAEDTTTSGKDVVPLEGEDTIFEWPSCFNLRRKLKRRQLSGRLADALELSYMGISYYPTQRSFWASAASLELRIGRLAVARVLLQEALRR